MIKICDAIMGAGKTTAAINYINEHPEQHFIYITPYLEEADRIKQGCPKARFVEPSAKIPEYEFRKRNHTAALIKKGRNIATTHQAFKLYTDEMLQDIKHFEYTLIIDENVDVLERFDCHPDDIQIAVESGYVKEENNIYTLVKNDYHGFFFRDLFKFMKMHQLIKLEVEQEIAEAGDKECLFYWVLPPELMLSFKDVFVLTYLFEGQGLHHFMKIYDLPYEYIGIEKCGNENFKFGDYPGYTPEYLSNLKEMINVLNHPKLNNIGDDPYALSMTWFQTKPQEVLRLKKNIYNCVNNIWKGVPKDQKLWACYKSHGGKLRGKGYSNSFLTFNMRAVNAYRNRKYLIYAVNLFMNVSDKIFYESRGVEIDEDMYALSIMVQWIWRSAIRDGDKIDIYIPSSRMRKLLTDWINKVSKGGVSS